MIYNNALDLIGNTPILNLKEAGYPNVFVKLEKANPGGSIKDRAALYMINGAEEKGILNKDSVLVEATSGNTGIALAMAGKLKGYKVIIIMPDTMSIERRQLVKAFGAELILTEGAKGMAGSIEKANELLDKNSNYICLGQFDNEDNPRAHYETTGPEILKEVKDVSAIVAGIGSGGTIVGAGKFLKEKNKDLEDKYLRSEAEIQNMQNRYTKERAQLIKYESQSLAKDVLPAMDNLERALSVEADDDVSKQLKKGVQMTLDALVKAMKDHGVVEIEADGVKFDPTLHQAVQTVAAENDDQKDHVVQVLQKGYQYKDRTLRPAMVVVAQ